MRRKTTIVLSAGLAVGMLLGSGCRKGTSTEPTGGPQGKGAAAALSGTIRIDGSSTVFPITEAVAEEFGRRYPGVRVTVGVSGTGGGFKKFCIGELEISDASRPIKEPEIALAAAHNIAYIELPVAYDGIAVVTHPRNDFVETLTLAELKHIWQPGSMVRRWSDVRPHWPDRGLRLYGPGTDSGTFDYFTEAVVGEAKASRPDYMASEDDNVLVQGVGGDHESLGYFGFAYYTENRNRLQLVPIDGGKGAILPSVATIEQGSYPLSRPIFIYVNAAVAQRPEVAAFVRFYLESAPTLVPQVGYIPLPAEVYRATVTRFLQGKTGSMFTAAPRGATLAELLQR